ncbi:DUF4440 domain-containing protein [Rhodococcus rhodnii]|uniref:Steroid delta-isomerase n=2 Tax=Rhodococcus rhodnii TaxID=38312 RepID=R7WMP0_9NOCA|nr:nuclear transport factor 2 family protein [Rhodococcus rhodnii]EOM76563.1 steroid delta-isomerase [Rhodococcus rhodnii LMG 5362]TXG92170.1 DUF4440 domain-containing protein [Rhodococcus rhodnii]
MTQTTTLDAQRATVARYLDAVASKSAAEIAALYAPEGTLEDPVGSEPVRGRAAITEFYAPLEQASRATELLSVRATEGGAAFSFRVTTTVGGATYEVEPIDVMTFEPGPDGDLLITSMRAFWAPEDMKEIA